MSKCDKDSFAKPNFALGIGMCRWGQQLALPFAGLLFYVSQDNLHSTKEVANYALTFFSTEEGGNMLWLTGKRNITLNFIQESCALPPGLCHSTWPTHCCHTVYSEQPLPERKRNPPARHEGPDLLPHERAERPKAAFGMHAHETKGKRSALEIQAGRITSTIPGATPTRAKNWTIVLEHNTSQTTRDICLHSPGYMKIVLFKAQWHMGINGLGGKAIMEAHFNTYMLSLEGE